MEIDREKTRVVDLREEAASLEFLGYTYPMSIYCEIDRYIRDRLIQHLQRRSQRRTGLRRESRGSGIWNS